MVRTFLERDSGREQTLLYLDIIRAAAGQPVDLVHQAELHPVAWMNVSTRYSPSRPAERADSPASVNSATILAPSSSALRRLASRWAGMEKPSEVPPRSACSRVETRRYETANNGGLSAPSEHLPCRRVLFRALPGSRASSMRLNPGGWHWQPVGIRLTVEVRLMSGLSDIEYQLHQPAHIRLIPPLGPQL